METDKSCPVKKQVSALPEPQDSLSRVPYIGDIT